MLIGLALSKLNQVYQTIKTLGKLQAVRPFILRAYLASKFQIQRSNSKIHIVETKQKLVAIVMQRLDRSLSTREMIF